MARTQSVTLFSLGILLLLLVPASDAWAPRASAVARSSSRRASISPSDSSDLDGSSSSNASQDPIWSVAWDWKALAEDVFQDSSKPIILFDGVCNFCNEGVNKCLDLDSRGNFRYASLQSRVGQALLLRSGKAANDWSSIVLVQKKKAFFESDAILKIAQELAVLPPAVRALTGMLQGTLPQGVRDEAYKVVARNRYLFGESDGPSCRLDLDPELMERFVPDPDDDES